MGEYLNSKTPQRLIAASVLLTGGFLSLAFGHDVLAEHDRQVTEGCDIEPTRLRECMHHHQSLETVGNVLTGTGIWWTKTAACMFALVVVGEVTRERETSEV